MFMRIPYDPCNTRQAGNFLGRTLGITSRHENAAIGILRRTLRIDARASLSAFSVTVQVFQDNNFGIPCGSRPLQSAFYKLALERRPVRLGGAAAKILYVETRHTPILTE